MSDVMAFRLGRAHVDGGDERGFTLIEMTVALGLTAFVFAALASVLGSAVRTLALQKARSQANEVATLGIEDLQRRSFDKLVLCTTPTLSTGATDPGLGSVIKGSGCPSPVPAGYEGDPCSGTIGSGDVPASAYSCTRVNRTMYVRRYIVWADPTQTGKRLAVYVDWTDTAGHHQVSQQSSLRSPTGASLVGQSPPTLSSPVTNPTTVQLNSDGTLSGSLSLSVTSSGMTATDKMFALVSTLDSTGNAVINPIAMTTSGSGASLTWTGTFDSSAGYLVGQGSQFVTFTGVRAGDGKAASIVSGLVKFCNTSDSSCSSALVPGISSTSVNNGASIGIDGSGALKADVPLRVVTTNMLANDSVTMQFAVNGGTATVPLSASSCSTANNTTTCTWVGTIAKSTGYGFSLSPQQFYVTAAQDRVAGSTIDQGNTTATPTAQVTFS